jgi:hypothetical protein
MSKISLEGNVSGSGTLTIAAPNTNTNYTLTLPSETGTLVTTGITSGLNASALTTGTVNSDRLPTVPVSKGGTGATTLTGVVKGNGTSAFTAGNVNLTSEITGTLPVANGGTGATTLTANNVILGNGTSAVKFVAPGSSGNILTSNGTTWTSATPAGGGVTSLNGQTGAIVDNTANSIGSYVTVLKGDGSQSATYGTNYAAGSSAGQLKAAVWFEDNGWQMAQYTGQISGTWRWMSATQPSNFPKNQLYGIAVRVA